MEVEVCNGSVPGSYNASYTHSPVVPRRRSAVSARSRSSLWIDGGGWMQRLPPRPPLGTTEAFHFRLRLLFHLLPPALLPLALALVPPPRYRRRRPSSVAPVHAHARIDTDTDTDTDTERG